MKRFPLFGSALLLVACGRNPNLTPGAESVRVTASQATVATCQSVGMVQGKDGRGGFFGKGMAARSAEVKVKNAAAAKGANVVLQTARTNGFWGSSVGGEAFKCGA